MPDESPSPDSIDRIRDILGLNGEMEQDIRCNATESGGQYAFTIRAFGLMDPEDEFGIVIRGLAVNTGGGGVIGNTCRFQVEDGGNTYEGLCGATMTTSDVQPCYISPVVISDTAAGPQIEDTFVTRAVQRALVDTRRDGTRQVGALLPVRDQLGLGDSHQEAVVVFARVVEDLSPTHRHIVQ